MTESTAIAQAPDTTPKYIIKQVSDKLGISSYTIRYYENIGLIPFVERKGANVRMFSDYTIEWLKLVICLRKTGMPIEEVKLYNDLCLKGDSTINERLGLIKTQEERIDQQIEELKKVKELLKRKKGHYNTVVKNNVPDPWNPLNIYKKEPAEN